VQALAEMGVEKIKKERFGVGAKKRKAQDLDVEVQLAQKNGEVGTEKSSKQSKNDIHADVEVKLTESGVEKSKRSRYIPLPVRRAVFSRAAGKCEYKDPLTKRRCNSSKYLQLHHTTAFAKGGEHAVESLAAYCFHHNKLAAIDDFGSVWMDQFLRAPSRAS